MVIAQIYELLGTAGLDDAVVNEPLKLDVSGSNPFTHQTEVAFSISDHSLVGLNVYDQLGRRVCQLGRHWQAPGNHRVVWDGKTEAGYPAANGVYFIRIDDQERTTGVRLVKIR